MKKCCANCKHLIITPRRRIVCDVMEKHQVSITREFVRSHCFFDHYRLLYEEGGGYKFFRLNEEDADEDHRCQFEENCPGASEIEPTFYDFPHVTYFHFENLTNQVHINFAQHPVGSKENYCLGALALEARFFIGTTSSNKYEPPTDSFLFYKKEHTISPLQQQFSLFDRELIMSGTYNFHTSLEDETELIQVNGAEEGTRNVIYLYGGGLDKKEIFYQRFITDWIFEDEKTRMVPQELQIITAKDFFKIMKNSFWYKLLNEEERN